jgi:hypothetical protein
MSAFFLSSSRPVCVQGFGRPLAVDGLHACAISVATEAITKVSMDAPEAPSLALSMLSDLSNIGVGYKKVWLHMNGALAKGIVR